MPVSHQFNRRIAAIGAALALVALPISSTFTPAFAQPSPSPSAEAGSTGTADAEAAAGADGTDSSSRGGSADGGDSEGPGPTAADSDPDAGSESAEADGSEGDEGDDDTEPDPNYDKACAAPEKGDPTPGEDGPCKPARTLKAEWDSRKKQLYVTAPNGDPGDLPESWVGESFKGPTDQKMVKVPAQDASAEGTAEAAGSDGSDTDDSGRSVADATAQADAPEEFEFRPDGKIRVAGGSKAMRFKNFPRTGPDPMWTFTADGKQITAVEGEKYPDSDGTADSEASGGSNSTANKDGGKNTGTAASEDGTQDGGSRGSASADDDSADSAGSDASGRNGNEDGSSSTRSASNSNSSSDSSSSSDSNSSSNSGSKDRANSATDDDADGKNSDSDSGSRSDGSRNSDSDSSGSGGSDSSSKDDDGNDSDDPDGSPVGTADGDNTTPDPSNGNGSKDDERETIPGTAGDEWLPGDEDHSERPDYSDPVPQNPDAPTPKDDTDLITGGDKPSPRANQQPSTSFGESIVSTIVSSWPVFVLAASGMAAVGFIIYIMGRRGKQD